MLRLDVVDATAIFVESSLSALFTNSTGQFGKACLTGFIPPELIDQLPDPTEISQVIVICRRHNAMAATLELVLESLNRDWNYIKPDVKLELVDLIQRHGMTGRIGTHQLTLSGRDKDFLKIRWDVAERFYKQKKKETLDRLKKVNIDLRGQNAPALLSDGGKETCFKSLRTLLEEKIEFELAVVGVSAPRSEGRFFKYVFGRCFHEYLDLVVLVREALMMELLRLRSDCSPYEISEIVEAALDKFKNDANDLLNSLDQTSVGDSTYNRVRKEVETFKRRKVVRMTQYINKGNVGAMGEGAKPKTLTNSILLQVWKDWTLSRWRKSSRA